MNGLSRAAEGGDGVRGLLLYIADEAALGPS